MKNLEQTIEGLKNYYSDKQNNTLKEGGLSAYVDIVDGRYIKAGNEKTRLDTFCKKYKIECCYTDGNLKVSTRSVVAAPSLSEHIIKFFLSKNCFGLENLPEVTTIFELSASFDNWFNIRNKMEYEKSKAAKKAAKKAEEAKRQRESRANEFKSAGIEEKAAELVEMGVFDTLDTAKKHLEKQASKMDAAKVTTTAKKGKQTA